MQEPLLGARHAAGLPSAPAAAPGLQTITEKRSADTPKQSDEDVFAQSNPEELLLGGHELDGGGIEGGGPRFEGPLPTSSSLTEALAAEAIKAAASPPTLLTEPPQVGCSAPTG